MRVINPSFEFVGLEDGVELVKRIEVAGRVCYKTEGKITEDSYKTLVKRWIDCGHLSTIEHEKVTVRVICDRGVTHEIVRHRIASYSQESTRYCNYSKDQFGREITVIRPFFFAENSKEYESWLEAMTETEAVYLTLINMGASPQQARSVLPNSLKTEIVMTMNMREWRHFFALRTTKACHPQMRQVAIAMLVSFKRRIPVLFDDIEIPRDMPTEHLAQEKS